MVVISIDGGQSEESIMIIQLFQFNEDGELWWDGASQLIAVKVPEKAPMNE